MQLYESYTKSLVEEWPSITFESIEHIEIDYMPAKVFYQSFFKVLHFPEMTMRAFLTLLTTDPDFEGSKK